MFDRRHQGEAAAAREAGFDALSYADALAHSQRGSIIRLAFTALVALVVSAVVSPLVAFFAFLACAAWEFVGRPALETLVAPANRQTTSPRAFLGLSAVYLVGTGIYSVPSTLAALSGAALGMQIATCWIGGAAIHTFVYYSNSRPLLIVNLAVPILGALALPAMNAGRLDVQAVLTTTMIITLLVSAGVFASDRNDLLKSLASQVAARRVAEAASATKTQFLTTMSHELRTPLNAVIGYAEILDEDLAALHADAPREDARRIGAAGRHLLALIDDVLDMSRIESGALSIEPVDTDILALLREVQATVRPLADARGNEIALVTPPHIPLAYVDGVKLRQCLFNLASNACKFTQNGRITMQVEASDDRIAFKIADTGVGIDPAVLPRLFEAFVQSDNSITRKFGGTGLGLAITRRLARLMGGDVRVDSVPAKGSTFTLWVRAAERPGAPRSDAAPLSRVA
jgi:signal transduction histidine kinase